MPHPLIGFGLSRQAALSHHLQYNHYPPVDPRWVPIAQAAIDLAVSQYELSEDGASIDSDVLNEQVGQGKTAQEVLDGLHLWDFVEYAIAADDSDTELEPKRGE